MLTVVWPIREAANKTETLTFLGLQAKIQTARAGMQFDSLEVLFIHSIRAPITDPIADDPPPKKLAIPCNRSWHGRRNVPLYYSV